MHSCKITNPLAISMPFCYYVTNMFILTRQCHGNDGNHLWTITISPIVDFKTTESLIPVRASRVTENACEILTCMHHDDMCAALTVIVEVINVSESYQTCDQIYKIIKNLGTNDSDRILHFFKAFKLQLYVFLEAIQQIIVSLLDRKSETTATS
jgi:hypothetical protein